jgi:biotin carboxyl carrier protein
MKWLVKNKNKSLKVSAPKSLVSNIPFEVSVDGKIITVKWQESSKTLYILERSPSGTILEKPISLRNISITQFPGDNEKSVAVEISGAHAENVSAKVSRYVPGQENRDKAKGAKGAVVRSPITGKVLKVNIAEGDQVENGVVLLTIEAMKMENKIFSTAAGNVAKLSVKEGDMVSVGAELVAIK